MAIIVKQQREENSRPGKRAWYWNVTGLTGWSSSKWGCIDIRSPAMTGINPSWHGGGL